MVNKKYLKTRLDHHSSGTAVTGTAESTPDVPAIVKDLIDTIRKDSDIAVRKYSEKFDKWPPRAFRLSKAEIDDATLLVPSRLSKISKKFRETFEPLQKHSGNLSQTSNLKFVQVSILAKRTFLSVPSGGKYLS